MKLKRELRAKKPKGRMAPGTLAKKARALSQRGGNVPWIETLPPNVKQQVVECCKRSDISINGLLKALHEEGYTSATRHKIQAFRAALREG